MPIGTALASSIVGAEEEASIVPNILGGLIMSTLITSGSPACDRTPRDYEPKAPNGNC